MFVKNLSIVVNSGGRLRYAVRVENFKPVLSRQGLALLLCSLCGLMTDLMYFGNYRDDETVV